MSTPVREELTPLNGLAGYQPPTTRPRPMAQQSYAQLQPYTATSNLRGTQIAGGPQDRARSVMPSYQPARQVNPNDQRTAQAGAYGQQAAGQVVSPAAQQARAMSLRSLSALEGPNRGQIAQDVYQQMVDASQPAFEQSVRQVGQDAARFGRLGSGVTTTRLGDLYAERNRDLDLSRRALASEAAGLTLDDRLGVLNAGLGAGGQFTSEDLGRSGAYRSLSDLTFGQGRDVRGELRLDDDRGFERGALQREEARREDDRSFNRDLALRDELRGERGFQNEMQQQALSDMIRQRTLEEMLLSGEWGRDMDYNQFLAGTGYGG